MKKTIAIFLWLMLFFACKKNQAPKDFVIQCPPFGYKDSLVVFKVKAVDPEGDEISYKFDWGDGNQGDWSPFLPSDSFYSESHRFSETLKFYVRVKGKDKKGKESDWQTKEFSVITHTPGKILWRFFCDEEGDFIASCAIDTVDGTIYCGCDAGHLHALKPDGKERWCFSVNEAISSSPLINDSRNIIFATEEGGVYCLSPGGTLLWSLFLGEEVLSSPALGSDGSIYLSTPDSIFLISSSGQVLASRGRDGGEGISSPSIDLNGTVFTGGLDFFSAYPPDLGPAKWEILLPDEVRSSPAIDNLGNVYFGCDNGAIYKDSTVIRYLYGPVSASPVVLENLVIAADEEGYLCGFTTAGGDSWPRPFSTGGIPSTPLISTTGVLYVAVDYGKKQGEDSLFALSLSTGERLWATPVKVGSDGLVSSPALSKDGIIYLGEEGGIVAIVGQGKLASGNWPMFRGNERHTGKQR
ncbi:MAG: PQQ-binding-like beta-propeller repeat protein [candidate division WOR-3 bacterium]